MKHKKVNIESNTLFVYRSELQKLKQGAQGTTDPTTATITITTTTHSCRR